MIFAYAQLSSNTSYGDDTFAALAGWLAQKIGNWHGVEE
jgi:hypothetical protein